MAGKITHLNEQLVISRTHNFDDLKELREVEQERDEMAGRIERAIAGIDGLLSNLNPGEPVPVTKRQMGDLRAILAGDERSGDAPH
jgi:hypothetical protein